MQGGGWLCLNWVSKVSLFNSMNKVWKLPWTTTYISFQFCFYLLYRILSIPLVTSLKVGLAKYSHALVNLGKARRTNPPCFIAAITKISEPRIEEGRQGTFLFSLSFFSSPEQNNIELLQSVTVCHRSCAVRKLFSHLVISLKMAWPDFNQTWQE